VLVIAAAAAPVSLSAQSLPFFCDAPARAAQPIDPGLQGEIRRLGEHAEALLKAFPETTGDPLAVVLGSEMSPGGLGDWVASNTVLRAYRGSLRGARGVLADRQGNSLDRALLLAEMLSLAGYDARLARAALAASDVAALRDQLGGDARVPVLADRADGDLAAAVPAAEVSNDDILCGLELERRIDSHTDTLFALIGGLDGPDALVDAALADHWWVQVNDGGSWRDLDPTGLSVAAEWTGAADTLPAGLSHTISVSVVAETAVGERIIETELVALSRPAAGLAGATLSLRLEPIGTPPLDGANIAAWLAEARGANEWVPILVHGDDVDAGKSVTLTGRIGAVAGGVSADVRETGATGGGLLGGGLGGGGRKAPAADGMLTALWIDYRIEVPGLPVRHERRRLFDLRGPAARHAGAPAPETLSDGQIAARERGLMTAVDILVTAGDPTPVTLPRQRLAEALEFYRFADTLLTAVGAGDVAALEAATKALPIASPLMLYGLAGLRDVSGAHGVPALHDQPTVLSMHRGPGAVPGTLRIWTDIVRSDPAIELGPRAAMRHGVADTVLEAAILDEPGQPLVNAADILEVSLNLGEAAWAVAHDEAELARFALPEDVLALMRASIRDGNIVIAPAAPVGEQQAIAWWRVDPATGATLGMSRSGFGASTAEYIETVFSISIKVSSLFGCTKRLVDFDAAGKPDAIAAAKIGICFANAAIGGYVPYVKLHKLSKIRRLNRQSKVRAELYTDYMKLAARAKAGGKNGVSAFTRGEKHLYDMFAGRGTFSMPTDQIVNRILSRFTDVLATMFTVSTLSLAGR